MTVRESKGRRGIESKKGLPQRAQREAIQNSKFKIQEKVKSENEKGKSLTTEDTEKGRKQKAEEGKFKVPNSRFKIRMQGKQEGQKTEKGIFSVLSVPLWQPRQYLKPRRFQWA